MYFAEFGISVMHFASSGPSSKVFCKLAYRTSDFAVFQHASVQDSLHVCRLDVVG